MATADGVLRTLAAATPAARVEVADRLTRLQALRAEADAAHVRLERLRSERDAASAEATAAAADLRLLTAVRVPEGLADHSEALAAAREAVEAPGARRPRHSTRPSRRPRAQLVHAAAPGPTWRPPTRAHRERTEARRRADRRRGEGERRGGRRAGRRVAPRRGERGGPAARRRRARGGQASAPGPCPRRRRVDRGALPGVHAGRDGPARSRRGRRPHCRRGGDPQRGEG